MMPFLELSERMMIACAATGLASLAFAHERDVRPPRPNVILILTDDQGYGDLACHGNPFIETPNLDKLHGESVRWTNFHVDPVCTPTRAALMTGRYSIRTGAWRTAAGRSMLRKDEVTIANVFSAAGYRTGMFGKWHLGDNYPYRPHDRGFHQTVWHRQGAIGMAADVWGNDYFDDKYQRNDTTEQFRGYCTDVFFDEAIQFIESTKDKPFFIYLSTNAPHNPYLAPEEYCEPYRKKGLPETTAQFMGMVTNIDANVGRLLNKLESSGLADNTLVIFMTDNGALGGLRTDPDGFPLEGPEAPGSYGASMRGSKGTPYEGGHRVPCFLRWPNGGLTGGRDIDSLSAHIDILPTLIELCGLGEPEAVRFDGISLVPFLFNPDAVNERELFIAHLGGPLANPTFEISPFQLAAALTPRWRLVFGQELYDIIRDPLQRTDVSQQYPHILRALRKSQEQWFADVTANLHMPCRIVLGSEAENPVELNLQDWYMLEGNPPWYQRRLYEQADYVSSTPAPYVNGPWMVDIARSGVYEFTLRQLPVEADFPIQAVAAKIEIGDFKEEKAVPNGATAAAFSARLDHGEHILRTWFVEQNGKTRGAFYVRVRYFSP